LWVGGGGNGLCHSGKFGGGGGGVVGCVETRGWDVSGPPHGDLGLAPPPPPSVSCMVWRREHV
jgi:hypothetical protein